MFSPEGLMGSVSAAGPASEGFFFASLGTFLFWLDFAACLK